MQLFGTEQTRLGSEAITNLPGLPCASDVETQSLMPRVADIKSKLEKLREKVNPQDTVVIYTHSHGLPAGLGIDWETHDKTLIPLRWGDDAEAIVSLLAKT